MKGLGVNTERESKAGILPSAVEFQAISEFLDPWGLQLLQQLHSHWAIPSVESKVTIGEEAVEISFAQELTIENILCAIDAANDVIVESPIIGSELEHYDELS